MTTILFSTLIISTFKQTPGTEYLYELSATIYTERIIYVKKQNKKVAKHAINNCSFYPGKLGHCTFCRWIVGSYAKLCIIKKTKNTQHVCVGNKDLVSVGHTYLDDWEGCVVFPEVSHRDWGNRRVRFPFITDREGVTFMVNEGGQTVIINRHC